MIRYRPDTDEQGRSFEMIPDEGGDYVAHEDYEELEKMVDNLRSVIESDEKLVEELTEKLKATEEEMLFWRRESRLSDAGLKMAEDKIKELEALNVLLLAERDTLEAENTMFRMSNDANASKAQRLEARVAKLEAELAEAREALRQINASVPSDGEEYLTECGRCIASAEIADAALTGEEKP